MKSNFLSINLGFTSLTSPLTKNSCGMPWYHVLALPREIFMTFVWFFSSRSVSVLLGWKEVPLFTLSSGQRLTRVYLTECSQNNRLPEGRTALCSARAQQEALAYRHHNDSNSSEVGAALKASLRRLSMVHPVSQARCIVIPHMFFAAQDASASLVIQISQW